MKRKTSSRMAVTCAILALTAGGRAGWSQGAGTAPPMPMREAPAQANSPRWPSRSQTMRTILISPMAPGKPALAYGLVPTPVETRAGNAATSYLKAAVQLPELKPEEVEYLDVLRNDAPLADMNENDPKLRELLSRYTASMSLLRQGARIEGVDWGTNIREQGISALLPHLGKIRQLSNALALQVRIDIKKHDWAAARDKLETGYMLALHAMHGETLIEALVGVAIAAQMNQRVEDWVDEPGAPNLYWPLVNMPSMGDIRRVLSFERSLVYFSMPEMREIKAGHYSADLWVGLMNHMSEAANMAGASMGFGSEAAPTWKSQVAATGLGIVFYPAAKRYLRSQGLTAEAVERMPVPEAVERYFVQTYEEEADDAFKWVGLPPPEASRGMQQWSREFQRRSAIGEVNLMARILLPALGRAMLVSARADRQIAMLRIVEAIRAHAADSGALPAKLEDLALPVPKDVTTGESFGYQLQGETAILDSPSNEPSGGMRYEIKLRK